MNLWRQLHLPLSEVGATEKRYFSTRFLHGTKIDKASKEDLEKAFDELEHAVGDGCKGRCQRLVDELNEALCELGLAEVQQPQNFLKWLVNDYEVKRDDNDQVVIEKPYGFEIRIFHDAENRKEFWAEAQALLKSDRMMSMQDICKVVLHKRRHSKQLID